jgi:hypothetical protein
MTWGVIGIYAPGDNLPEEFIASDLRPKFGVQTSVKRNKNGGYILRALIPMKPGDNMIEAIGSGKYITTNIKMVIDITKDDRGVTYFYVAENAELTIRWDLQLLANYWENTGFIPAGVWDDHGYTSERIIYSSGKLQSPENLGA